MPSRSALDPRADVEAGGPRTLQAHPVASLVVAGALVGGAIQVRLSRYDGLALAMAVVGAGLVVTAVASHTPPPTRSRWLRLLVRGLLIVQVLAFLPLAIVALHGADRPSRALAVGLGAVAIALAIDQLQGEPWTGRWGRAVLCASVAGLGILWIVNVPTNIDVWHYQTEGARRLLGGENPYAPGYPNPYDAVGSADFFAPGLVRPDGLLDFGFPYPPLSLVLSTVGSLFGDVRVAHLAAMVTAGWLLLHLVEDSWASRAGGVLFLTTPMLLPVVQRGWTEAFLALALVATVHLLRRRTRADAVALGLFLAVKQYAVLFLPILLLVAPRWHTATERWRALWTAVAVAAVVTVPLALWDLGEFVFSVGLLQLQQPFRPDAMSLPAQVERFWADGPAEALALPGILLAIGLSLWWVLRRAPRTWFGACTGIALVMLAFLLFNKQAFTNYYFFAVAVIWTAVAAADDRRTPPRTPSSASSMPDRR